MAIFALQALAALAAAEESASSPVESRPIPIAIEALELVVEPEGPAEALPRLIVRVRNRSAETVAGWSFEVRAGGEIVDGYRDLMALKVAGPGDVVTLELYRLEQPPEPFELEVRILEAWTARSVPVNEAPGDGSSEWRLIAPLEGTSVSAMIWIGQAP